MPHPAISHRPRPAVLAGVAGAVLLVTAPAAAALGGLADTAGQTCGAVTGTVESLDAVLEPACQTVEDAVEAVAPVAESVVEPVQEVAEPVTEPVGEVLAPAVEVLPDDVVPEGPPPADDGAAEPAPAGPAPASPDGDAEQSGEVEAAGKTPTEVVEPQGPAAEGRVAGPALQPPELGANIAGLASRGGTGLTLQPYEAPPMVSIPSVLQEPVVAGAPATTASPVAAVASEALEFAGSLVLPRSDGHAVLLVAAGLGLATTTGWLARRRMAAVTTTLDEPSG